MLQSSVPPPTRRVVRRNEVIHNFVGFGWLADEEAPADDPFAEKKAFYRTAEGIVRFPHEVLKVDLAAYQEEILYDLVVHKRMAVRGPHGLGKTALSAWVVLWAMCCFDTDVKVITTASAWRQVTHFTWPEIKMWAGRADFGSLGLTVRRGQELLELQMKLPGNKEAFAAATKDPALIEGAHATTMVYVYDEAKAIPNDIWDAAEGAFSAAGEDTNSQAFALAISTPGTTSGRFYEICTRKPGTEDWRTRHVTLEESIAAGRISRLWAEQRAKQWGEESAVYKNRVLGEFDDSADENVIPLSWVELANVRWREAEGKGVGRIAFGVDPAYLGNDKTAIARLVGRVLEDIETYAKKDTMWTAGKVAALIANREIPVAIDTVGVGAGVYDRLREQRYRVRKVGAGEKAIDPYTGQPLMDATHSHQFVNMRAYLWWSMREALDPAGDDPLALPPIDELTGDLTAPTYWHRSDGKIQVESKDDLRERIGRSTDYADALALALWAARLRKMIMV